MITGMRVFRRGNVEVLVKRAHVVLVEMRGIGKGRMRGGRGRDRKRRRDGGGRRGMVLFISVFSGAGRGIGGAWVVMVLLRNDNTVCCSDLLKKVTKHGN